MSELFRRVGKLPGLVVFTLLLASVLLGSFSAPLQAQQFAPIHALSFVKPFGGTDPLPQTLTIASVGAAFNFGIAFSTSTGGNWLSVSPAGCCYTTPHVNTATVTTSAALAAGVYSGQIVVTSQSGTVSITIPVTLTVEPPGGTFFDNLPGQMSFSLATAGLAPPAQAIQVRNGGSGTLNWSLSTSTSDGGNWLSASSLNGTATSTVNVTLLKQNLPGGGMTAGTFIGQLLFQATSGNVTVPVSVVVGDNVLGQVNAIRFTKQFGGADPLPQLLTFASTGTEFNVSITSATATGGNWLTVSPGGCCYSTPHAFTATVTASPTLAAGSYTGQILVTSQTGSMSITVPVILTVASGGAFLDNLPGQMSFSLLTHGATLTSQEIEVRNGGSGLMNWTVTGSTADGGNWLSISPPNGTAPSLVTVGVSVPNLPNAGLVAGTFIGQLVFETAGSSVTVPISVVVGDSIIRQVNAINFTKVFAGADPLPQNLIIASTGTDFNIAISFSTATGGNWLSVTPAGCCYSTPHAITATVNASPTLAAGTYTGQIVITTQTGSMAITVPVTLTVSTGGPFFDNVPGQMSFSFMTGAAAPPSQAIQIRNAGSGTLNWSMTATTSDGGSWLSPSALSGTAPSLVSVSVLKQNLPGLGLLAGTFTGELVFQTAGSTVTIPVTVIVGANVFSQVNAISFTKPLAGANPLPQTLTIASTAADFNFAVAFSSATGGNWLSISPVGCCYTTPRVLTATVNASPTLAAGTYTGQIVVTSQTGSMAMTVPVTLTVSSGGPFFDNVPGQMSFSFTTSSGNPPAQSIQIRNAGSGVLNWTLATSTSDSGNWLSVSAASGTAPSSISVGIVANALPGQGLVPGVFTGELVLQTPGSSVTVEVSVIVGPSVFNQLGGLTFRKQFGGSNPLSQNVNIASTATAFNFSVVASSANGGNWLSVSPSGCCYTTPRVHTVTVNASPTLPAGTYTGQIVATSQSGSMAMTVPVTLIIGSPVSDFDGNGVPDTLLQFPDGSMGVWYLGGTGRLLPITGFDFLAGPSTGISLVNSVDLNGDGIPDLILRFTDGSLGVWYMGGPRRTTITGFAFISGPIPGWMPTSMGDLNGDGHLDLMIQNIADGSIGVWYLGGAQGNQIQGFAPISGPLPGWNVVGLADLDNNGHPDVILQYTDGSIGVWYMNGAQGNQIQSFALIAGGSTWSVVGTTDMDADGHPDLIIRNTDGTLGVWYLGGVQGNQITGFTPITTPGAINWRELLTH